MQSQLIDRNVFGSSLISCYTSSDFFNHERVTLFSRMLCYKFMPRSTYTHISLYWNQIKNQFIKQRHRQQFNKISYRVSLGAICFTCRLSLSFAAEYQHNTLTDKPKHSRTGSLPAGCPTFQEPLKISHKRTWSEPLTGEEVVGLEKAKGLEKHSSCKAVNGTEPTKKSQCARRASTGMRFKLSPAHSKSTYAVYSKIV